MSRQGVLVSRKKGDGKIEKELFSPESLKQNFLSVTNGRTIIAIAAGTASGILGLTGVQGALGYLIAQALFSSVLVFKLGLKYQPYFASWRQICVDGLFSSVTTYILFWTLAYNSVHVF